MGWRKILWYSQGGAIVLGSWKALYNTDEDSIDLEHASNGILYRKWDNAFSGSHYYTEVASGRLRIQPWPGWDDTTTAKDETYELDDATSWDDTVDNGEVVVNYLFGTTHSVVSWEGLAIFEAPSITLDAVGRYESSAIQWTLAANPSGSSTVVETCVFDGVSWGSWRTASNGGAIADLPGAGLSLVGWKVKYRVKMQANASGQTPEISDVTVGVRSRKHFRVLMDGTLKQSEYVAANVTTPIETLT